MLSFYNNVCSQNGEDGIILALFTIMGVRKGTFIDIDHTNNTNSNSFLLSKQRWKGVIINKLPKKDKQLFDYFKTKKNIHTATYDVFESNLNLDNIMEKYKHKIKKCHFLNLNLHGLEYEFLKKLNNKLPKVICFTVNPGIDTQFDKIIDKKIAGNEIGQSMFIYNELLSKKGYFPLCYTGYIFFVKNEYKEKFDFALSNKKVLQEFMNKKEVKSDIFNQSTIDKLKSCGENEFPEEKEYTNKLDKIYYEYIKYIYLYQPDKIWFLNKAFCKRKVFYGDIIRFENKILNKFIIDHEIDQHEKDVRGLQKHIRESIKQQTGEDNVLEYSLKV